MGFRNVIHPRLRPLLASTVVLAGVALLAMPQPSSANRPDPQPSPLFQQSLRSSVERFDQQADATATRISPERRKLAAEAGRGGRSAKSVLPARSNIVHFGEVSGTANLSATLDPKPVSTGPVNVPNPDKTALGGGDIVETATVIPSLPYLDNGTTLGFYDDYNEVCPYTPTGSPDVVYRYTPASDVDVDILLCNSLYDTKLYVYENAVTAGLPYACNDDFCGDDTYKSKLTCVSMTVGNTYYIIVDGYDAGSFGAYEISVAVSDPTTCGPCIWTGCSAFATPEGEACGEVPDVTNGGCNSSPEAFSAITRGETVCGTIFADGVNRDTDWYRLVLPDADSITWCVTANFSYDALVLDLTNHDPALGCSDPDLLVLGAISGAACEVVCMVGTLPAGTYAFFVAPTNFAGSDCADGPWEYEATLNPDDAEPPVVDDIFQSTLEICLIIDPDNPCDTPEPPTILNGPVRVRRGAPPYPPGNPSDPIPIEIVEMSLTGVSPAGFPVEVRVRTDVPSQGQVIDPNIDAGGNFLGAPQSFFDVFVEIEIVELTLVSQLPITLFSGPITQLPPYGTPYQTAPSQEPIPLRIKDGSPTAPPLGWICYVIHTPTAPMDCVCIYQLACASGPPDELAKLGLCVGDLRAGALCTCEGGTCASSLTTTSGNVCMEWVWTGACEPSALPQIPGAPGGCSCNPAPTMPSAPTCPGDLTCEGSGTCLGSVSCQGSSTCDGFYTCMNATCAAIQTCQSVTCTAEATCAGSEVTCSANVTCDYYPSCPGTETCETETCVGWSTCRGSQTCQGVPDCDPPPTYHGPECGNPTMTGYPSCHGSSTCDGFFTCMGASCAAIETCQAVTCTAEPTCYGSTATCTGNLTCTGYPSCAGTSTCGIASTCIGSASCQGSSTCTGAPTCEQPTFTGPTCEPTSCTGVSCLGGYCPPTMACDPSCPPLGHCPTSVGTPSCPAGGHCPTIIGAVSCAGGNCVTINGPSCDVLCPTVQGWFTCDRIVCVRPTFPNFPSCDVAICFTWFGAPSCPGSIGCFPTIAPMASCQGQPTCALVVCPPPTLPGNATCAGAATCPATPTCNPFGLTCAGVATCPPFASCGGASCPGLATCAGFNTCSGTATCVGGHTCGGNPTCAGTPTCDNTSATCIGVATCDIAPTCGGWPTCNGTATCDGVATCDESPTCDGAATCPGAASCSGQPTCDGNPTCAFSITCDGWPTCQTPPDAVPEHLKILLDSLRYGWVEIHFGPDTTEAFEYDDWHLGPLSPLMIWDEYEPVVQGEFVITRWLQPDIDSARVDTEYVRVLYEVGVDQYRDSNGNLGISVCDYLLLHFRSPVSLDSVSAWYHVEAIGQSQPFDSTYVIKLKAEIPPELSSTCACDCHADPACDGNTDVFDIVHAADVAFRNQGNIPDPNPLCPWTSTDVDCNGVTDVFDLVRLVNVAFRAQSPAANFCDSCP